MLGHLGLEGGRGGSGLGQQVDGVELAYTVEQLLGGGQLELGHRRAGQAVGLAELDDAGDGELAGRPLEQDLDAVADLEAVLVGGALVDHHLAAAYRGVAFGQGEPGDLPHRSVAGADRRGLGWRWPCRACRRSGRSRPRCLRPPSRREGPATWARMDSGIGYEGLVALLVLDRRGLPDLDADLAVDAA